MVEFNNTLSVDSDVPIYYIIIFECTFVPIITFIFLIGTLCGFFIIPTQCGEKDKSESWGYFIGVSIFGIILINIWVLNLKYRPFGVLILFIISLIGFKIIDMLFFIISKERLGSFYLNYLFEIIFVKCLLISFGIHIFNLCYFLFKINTISIK